MDSCNFGTPSPAQLLKQKVTCPFSTFHKHAHFQSNTVPLLNCLFSCPRAGYVTQGSKIKVWATKKEVDSRVYPDQTHCSYRMNTFNDKAKKSAAHKHTEFVRFRFQQSGFKRFCSSAKALASNVYIRLSSFFIFFHLSPSITLMALQDKCLQYGQERVLKNTFSISSL